MKSHQLTIWLLGSVFALLLLTIGALQAMTVARIDRIEAKVEAVQREYARIAVVEQRSVDMDRRMERMEARLDLILEAVQRR